MDRMEAGGTRTVGDRTVAATSAAVVFMAAGPAVVGTLAADIRAVGTLVVVAGILVAVAGMAAFREGSVPRTEGAADLTEEDSDRILPGNPQVLDLATAAGRVPAEHPLGG